MKQKTLKRTLWIAALTLAMLMTLTVLPGLSYEVEGPWGSGIRKSSESGCHQFWLRLPMGQWYYSYLLGADPPQFGGPEGISLWDGTFYFRFRTFEVYVQPQRP